MNFPDIADEAAEREQQLIAVALANRPKPSMTFNGVCHNGDCGEKIAKGFFCCAECREDFERVQWAQKQRAMA